MASGSSRPRVFSERPPTSSLVNSSKVLGREDDMWKIVGWLLSDKTCSNNDNNFSVLPIVGMGGVGKTTLAQLVYNHETVGKHFGLKAWVCVSEDFDVVRLTKEILESVTRSSQFSNSLDQLQMKLKEELSKKRFLLVLDDMWSENYERWDVLSTVFAFGKPGSKILVTTRSKGVSSIVRTDSNDHDYDLKGLSNDDSLALVRRHAFLDRNSSDADRKLKLFGEEIVKKCKGLPLAVKTFAGLLRDKMEDSEWEDILGNEIWDLRESEILPSLMLSYHHLPSLLKRCFAYCALFPKDYVFNKIELVTLWMAEGLVRSKGRKRLEDIGAGYFDELFVRSFFELSNRHPSNQSFLFQNPNFPVAFEEFFFKLSEELHIRSFFESCNNTGSGFVMHDLIHDLAEYVLGGIYCRREGSDKPSKVLATTRHLSFLEMNSNVEATEFEGIKNVRTFLDLEYFRNDNLSIKQLFPTMEFQFQFLRVLRFRKCRDYELLDSIGKLKHLRLIDLSFSDIERLPDSITSLYNLQTLILIGCGRLTKLPKDMGNLVNLRHLFLPSLGYASYEMPLRVGNLTSLQTLTTFIMGPNNNSELSDLSQLRGTLEISNLENLGNSGTEAMVVNLKNKSYLLLLRLRWSEYVTEDSDHESQDSFPYLGREEDVEEENNDDGSEDWSHDLCTDEKVEEENSDDGSEDWSHNLWIDEKVEEDVLDQLHPHTNLKGLWVENYGGTRFPSWIGQPSFFNLESVILSGFHNCKFLPHLWKLPLLKHLVIVDGNATKIVESELNEDGSSSARKRFQSLETLLIENMPELEEWLEIVEEEEGGQFPCLREALICGCPKLKGLPRLLPSIERLNLSNCDQLTILPDSNHPSPPPAPVHNLFLCLRELEIKCCPNMTESLMCILPTLESLKSLQLCDIPNLKSLPEGLHSLPSLERLEISNCPALESFPNMGLPNAIREMRIRECGKLNLLPLGLLDRLKNLQKLTISNCYFLMECKNLEPLHTLGLHNLTSLSSLTIGGCPALVSIPKGLFPTNLQAFIIKDCPSLESLPEGLSELTLLHHLEIYNCPRLKQQWKNKEGEEWSKVGHIPYRVAFDACLAELSDYPFRLVLASSSGQENDEEM
ncbi:putative disease resistance RPP13-like protein 1 [Telopea speciosissima]|uniref:putative disease resistance RPP13-like protein 1 n=1 Tax=Telopea speciosissima TaxID=54955 RepID=UPI001CC4D907|nr:putative disease resistance RPP13-like protein 1 [Telopea speciosissima]